MKSVPSMYTIRLLQKVSATLSTTVRLKMLVLTLGMIVVGLMEMALAGAISLLGVTLASPEGLQNSRLGEVIFKCLPQLHQVVSSSSPLHMIIFVLILITMASIAKNLSAAALVYQQTKTSQSIAWNICTRLFAKYLSAPFIWHTQQDTSTLNTCLTWRIYVAFYCQCVMNIISQVIIVGILMAGAFVFAFQVAPLFFFGVGVTSIFIYIFTKKKAQQCGEAVRKVNIEVNKISLSALQGIQEVQIYNQQKALSEIVNMYASKAIMMEVTQNLCIFLPSWVLETVGMLFLLLVVLFMANSNASLVEISGALTLMAAVSWRVLPAVNKIVSNIIQLKVYHAQVETVMAHAEVATRPQAEANHEFRHSLEFCHVSFRYPQAEKDTLADVSFFIPTGAMIGCIGMSGAGKSTLVGLLTGLLAPQSGEIIVDGKRLSPGPGYLRIGYVPQAPYIMDISLAENIAFSAYGLKPDIQRVMACCNMAGMDFLDSLPNGVDTILGERGAHLSGGQVQRVAIARALYDNPDILIFDEATSALDSAAEATIQKTILSLYKEVTIITVAHKLTIMESCDYLFWLKDGTIFRQGEPETILAEYKQALHALPQPSNKETKF